MPKGEYDRAAAARKRAATNAAKKAALEGPPPVDLADIKLGEFFTYQECLWVRIADMNLLGSKVKQYNQLSDTTGVLCCLKDGAMDSEWVRALPDNTKVCRLRLK